jgi:hypothetical protein
MNGLRPPPHFPGQPVLVRLSSICEEISRRNLFRENHSNYLLFSADLWQCTNCVGETPDELQSAQFTNRSAQAGSAEGQLHRSPGGFSQFPVTQLVSASYAKHTHWILRAA